ncbi:MAG: outer membrane beta-barrel protein [Deltaproteobacteria bacterium]|nr:outer membrane beta-barrel protein [Deltaproteobacteria bacterium]
MKKLLSYCLVSLIIGLGCVSAAWAASDMEKRLTTLEERIKELETKSETFDVFKGLTINGFVDGSYSYNEATEANTFGLDKAELYIESKLSDKAKAFIDLGFTDTAGGDADLEQGYITLALPVASGTDLIFGKFNAPIGFESAETPEMYQFSHALVFDFGIALFHTGLMVDANLGSAANLKLYAVNAWDENTDNNKDKTFGTRIGLTPVEGINVGLSGVWGPEIADNNHDKRTVFDLDFTVDAIENLVIGGELNYGEEENASLLTANEDAEWFGAMLMVHYDFADWIGLTLRYDYFDDEEGSRMGLVAGGDDVGKAVTRQAGTIAPTFTVAEGLFAILEYRYDYADVEYFAYENGTYKDEDHTVAVELTYVF